MKATYFLISGRYCFASRMLWAGLVCALFVVGCSQPDTVDAQGQEEAPLLLKSAAGKNYYIPVPEPEILSLLQTLEPGEIPDDHTLETVISIVVGVNGTVIT